MKSALRWMFGHACVGCGCGLPVGRDPVFCAICTISVSRAGHAIDLQTAAGSMPVVGLWRYGGAIASAIQRIKFGGAQPQLDGLVVGMGSALRQLAGPDSLALVPIPPQLRRLRGRGFHLPDRLAAALAADDPGLRIDRRLRRLDHHPPRSLRSDLMPEFVAPTAICRQPTWLIDDVVTTGITLIRAAAAMQAVGRPVAGAICLCDARPARADSLTPADGLSTIPAPVPNHRGPGADAPSAPQPGKRLV